MKNVKCSYCYWCDYCSFCSSCSSCDYCSFCSFCKYCKYCKYCSSCFFSKGLKMSESMIFCYNDGSYGKGYSDGEIGYQSNNCVFNVKVSRNDFIRIKDQIMNIFSDLKLELNEDNWSDEWKKVSNEKWIELSKVQYFNIEVVEKIIGFKLNLDENVKIEVDGKVVYISKKSAKALNLI